ncbi:hypothetical protein ACSQ67_007263 [Phaseolus vulgaris]
MITPDSMHVVHFIVHIDKKMFLMRKTTSPAYLESHRRSHSLGPNPSSAVLESVTNSHYDLLGSYVGSIEKAKEAIFYSYNRYINGFAAVLDEDEAANVAKNPNVISVFLNKERKLHTTHSWNFLGLERKGVFPPHSLWSKTEGEDVIIANIDTAFV